MTKEQIRQQLLDRIAAYKDEWGHTGAEVGLPKELRTNAVILVLVDEVARIQIGIDDLRREVAAIQADVAQLKEESE